MQPTSIINRWLSLVLTALCLTMVIACSKPSSDQIARDDLRLGLTFEPSGLDPTTGSASAIAEVVLYNLFETLTKMDQQGQVQPLLAQQWQADAAAKNFSFDLVKDAKFHNSVPLTAALVKYSFERMAQLNPNAEPFNNIAAIEVINDYRLVIQLKQPQPQLPLLLSQAHAIIVEPSSADNNSLQPIGTGPFEFVRWQPGTSVELKRFEQYRQVDAIKLKQVEFRFISDPAATINALLAHDVDLFFRGIPTQNAAVFANNPEFNLLIGNSSAKTIVAINHQHPPLDDVRVRRAISLAINRDELIANVANGYAVPIGSHYAPSLAGYIDTTAINSYNPQLAQQLLDQAGVKQPLTLSLKLPPVFYARQSGEIIAEQLKKVNINLRIELVEWARWMNEVYTNKNYDLSIISHVEPFDLDKPGSANYYFGYQSADFNQLLQQYHSSSEPQQRLAWLQKIQQLLAQDAVSVYLYNPQWISVADSRLNGVPQHFPIFVSDLSSISWQQ